MRIRHITVENWKNFRHADAVLQSRVFVVGPNASGKSNLLDAVRFLRDVADPEGGFQRAVKARGGVSQLRCLHARANPGVAIAVELEIDASMWVYRLEFAQDNRRRAVIVHEEVHKDGDRILARPDSDDEADISRLTQTHLEQVTANRAFRPVAEALAQIRYLHVVPQLIRDSERVAPQQQDPFGSDFLEQIARTNKRALESRLKRINRALRVAVPNLRELKLARDERGVPHLQGLYAHWRPNAGWQTEEQFSDGTLRLLGLLWALLDGAAPLLLEEPELSLHSAVVRHIPGMMAAVSRKEPRQVIVSTHSVDLLSDEGIAPEEVLLLEPTDDGTTVKVAASDLEIRAMLETGMSIGEIVLPRTAPRESNQLTLFGNE